MNGTVATLLLFFVVLASAQSEEIEEKNYESLLFNAVFKDYDKRVRPVKNNHAPVVVRFGIDFQQIIHVDEKRQVITSNIFRHFHWTDEFLQWKPENYGNISHISTLRSQTWTPDIQLYNSALFDKDELESNCGSSKKNYVDSNGLVSDVLPIIVKSTCKIDVTWFPFDEQKCSLVFGSWSTSSKYLAIQITEIDHESSATEMNNGEWSFIGVTSRNDVVTYACCPDDPYVRITYTIHLKRRPLYYFFNLLVPCGLIGFLAIFGFTLPPESGEKLSLGASILFSVIVFLNMISETMPANSDTVPLLGTYFNCVMFTIALSVVSTIVVNLNLKAVNPKKMEGLSEKLFLRWLPRILRMTPSSNIVAEQDKALPNKKTIGDTITLHFNRSGCLDSVVTLSLQSDKIATQQWNFVAAVVDRVCLVFSLIIIFLSFTIFLIYAF